MDFQSTLQRAVLSMGSNRHFARARIVALGVLISLATAGAAFLLHFNLSAAGSLQLLLVVFFALRWGFYQATVVSVTGVVCLNYFFTPPIFQLTVADPQNWVSLATFEATALLVSGRSSKVRLHAAQAERQRMRTEKLYELSRAILLIDAQRSTSEQLSLLIRKVLQVETVDFWVLHNTRPGPDDRAAPPKDGSAYESYLTETDDDDPKLRRSRRVLRLGRAPIGAIALCGWEADPLLADAVASLAAIALERARSVLKENRAEAARNTEQLRAAVLDGLAHSFKTPLTAIQTASSGLLAIGQLTPTQAELVSIIDERANMLNHLSGRLLRTAALEAKEVRLRRAKYSLEALLREVVEDQEESTRDRIHLSLQPELLDIEVDAQLIGLALLQLIDNAAKYSAVGGMIQISVTQDTMETMVVVANSGSSIRPEERERIFERFYRGVDSAHGPTGTGLGLSIVKKTAEAHGGRAWVEVEDDMTRFFFTIQQYIGGTNG